MTGTFSSFETALGALRYSRVAMDVAGGNLANVGTDGYTRRRAEAASVGAPAQLAMWSRYDGAGAGVKVAGVTRLSDELLNTRVRREHGTQAYLDLRQTTLERVENGIGEPGDSGVSAALADFRSAWHDLANAPDSGAARQQVLTRASDLVAALKTQTNNITDEQGDLRAKVLADVEEVNALAGNLAATNKAIAAGKLDGTDVGVLLDQRDQMALRLTELTGGTATVRPDGGMDVAIQGISLVSGGDAGALSVGSGITSTGATDGQPVTLAVTDPGGTTTTVAGAGSGEVFAAVELHDVTLPAFLKGLGDVASALADQVNALHAGGYDAAGTPGTKFFDYDPADPLGTLTVAITDPTKIAASSVGATGGDLDTGIADQIATAAGVEGSFQRLVSSFGTTVASAKRVAAGQQVVTRQVDDAREQLAGVNIDEETVSLVAAQHAYEAAARVMTTLDSVLDTLINRTGVTR